MLTLSQELGYFDASSPKHNVDPWKSQKSQLLSSALAYARHQKWSSSPIDTDMTQLLLDCAWATDGLDGVRTLSSTDKEPLLVDDIPAIINFLAAKTDGRIILLAGNCGIDLFCELRLAAALTSRGHTVEMHVKPYPCGVLGVTKADVDQHIQASIQAGLSFGKTLKGHLESGQFEIYENDFYARPFEMSAAPGTLKARYTRASMAFIFAEHNYRRLAGDRMIPSSFSFANLVGHALNSVPAAALKVCRSPVVVGVPESKAGSLSNEQDWCSERTLCVCQFSHAAQFMTDSKSSSASASSSSSIVGGQATSSRTVTTQTTSVQQTNKTSAENASQQTHRKDNSSSSFVQPAESSNNSSKSSYANADDYFGPDDFYGGANNSDEPELDKSESTKRSSSKRHRGGKDDDSVGDGDNEQEPDDLVWSDSSTNKLGLDAVLEEIGTKDMGRPYIKAHLPKRALSAFEYYCETRNGEDEDTLAENWSGMSKAQKQKFETLAQQDRIRYEIQVIEKAREVALIIQNHFSSETLT